MDELTWEAKSEYERKDDFDSQQNKSPNLEFDGIERVLPVLKEDTKTADNTGGQVGVSTSEQEKKTTMDKMRSYPATAVDLDNRTNSPVSDFEKEILEKMGYSRNDYNYKIIKAIQLTKQKCDEEKEALKEFGKAKIEIQKQKMQEKIKEIYQKYRDYYSPDFKCELDGDYPSDDSMTKKSKKENCWWINVDDFDNFVNEILNEKEGEG